MGSASSYAGLFDDWTDNQLCEWMDQPSPPEIIEGIVSTRLITCSKGVAEQWGEASNAFDGSYALSLSRFNPSEGSEDLGRGLLKILEGKISVAKESRRLKTSSTSYYDTLEGLINKEGDIIASFEVNALNGKGSPRVVGFSGNINQLQIKGKFDDYFEMIIKIKPFNPIKSVETVSFKIKEKAKESTEINTYGGNGYISESESPNFDSLKWSLYRKLHYRPLSGDRFYSVQASKPFNFQFKLREDSYIKQQMQTTPLLSYLLFEDGEIVVDEITPKGRFGDKFSDTSMFHSMSMGKSITSYLTGHAICEGKIKSVDSRLNWPILKNTLYDNQKLINLLNMASGDKAYSQNDESGESIQSRMATEFKGSKKSSHQYHYTNLNTNLVLSYLLYTYGEDDFKRLFDDVFQKKIGIKNEVWLNKTPGADKHEKSLGHQFFTTRYDFLRIARAMLEDWQNDTCVGQYLKTIHERRISKNGAQGNTGRVGMPGSYGGFFHTGYKGMENRPVMGMDGNGGQTILIDFERGRIVVTQSVFDNMKFPDKASFDWEKISYETIKNAKLISKSITANIVDPVMDPQELILHNEARRESDRKAKEYWDEYYDKIFFGGSADGSILLSEDFENLAGRDLLTDDRDGQWNVKKDVDGNSMYCNKKVTTDDYAGFNLGSENWRDYSLSYRMKFATGKGGELETHIRKNSSRQGEYRSVINSVTGNTYLKYVKGADRINMKIANGSKASIREKWTDVQLVASGKNISYIVNGNVVASVKDDRLKKGAVMFAVTSKSELCIDDIVIKKEIIKEEMTVTKEKKEDKFKSEKIELFKNIKSSDALDGYYSFTLVQSPMTQLGGGSLEINNGIVTITQDSQGIVKPSYASFEGRIDQNGDIKAIFYFHPCSGCEDQLVEFDGNLNKKKLSGKYKDTQINFYLTAKKGDVIKVETKKVETSNSDPIVSKIIEVTHGDKLIVDIAEPHELAGSNIKISLKDIDTPDATRSCPKQLELGEEVRDYVAKKLKNASNIKLTNFRKTNTKIIAQVVVDGADLGEELVSKGYASEEYGYWKPYFCSALSATNQADQYRDTDEKKAIFWYERSIVLDPDGSKNQESHFLLSEMYSNFGNADKSLKNLKKSASLNWIPAMEKLGSDYLNGNGIKKDPNQGKKWLKKAFNKGSQRAEDIYCGSLPKAKQKTCSF